MPVSRQALCRVGSAGSLPTVQEWLQRMWEGGGGVGGRAGGAAGAPQGSPSQALAPVCAPALPGKGGFGPHRPMFLPDSLPLSPPFL